MVGAGGRWSGPAACLRLPAEEAGDGGEHACVYPQIGRAMAESRSWTLAVRLARAAHGLDRTAWSVIGAGGR
ncbi:MAG: hypothetical protein ACKOYQ_09760, partial [Actinomycetota bacterium]